MRKVKWLAASAFAVTVLALSAVGVAHAQSFRSGDNVTVQSGQVVDNTLFVAGKTVDIAGTVNGDVFCAGQTVNISGEVNGDVLCAGQSVTVTGKVTGSVRLAGQTVNLNGSVSLNASLAGQSVTTNSSSTVGRDLSIGGQDATINGAVGRDVYVGATAVTIGNSVGRNVAVSDESLRLSSGAKVGGNVHYVSNNQLTQDPGAQVLGQVSKSLPAEKPQHARGASSLFGIVMMLLVLLLTAIILVLMVPRAFQAASATALSVGLLKTFVLGFVASIVVPVVAVGVMVTVVGIPFGLLLLLAWFVIMALSGAFAAYLAGRLIWRDGTNSIGIMLVGVVVLLILGVIPIINVITALLVLWFGAGMVLLQVARLGTPRYRTDALAKGDK